MGSRARAGRQLPRSFARQLLGCSPSIFSTRLFLLTGSEKPPARRSCWRRLRAPREAASGSDRGWISRELSPAARAEVERARRRVAGGDGLMARSRPRGVRRPGRAWRGSGQFASRVAAAGAGEGCARLCCALRPSPPSVPPHSYSPPLSLSPRARPRRWWARG